jgi:hypothetical protein
MKNLGLFCLLFVCVGLVSCNKNQKEASTPALAEKPISVKCYKALYEKDTVELKINTLQSGKITGEMEMKFINMPIKTGTIAGELRGDTLFADYSFIQGTNDKVTFKNPIAILKRGEELILGNGQIETYLGASYFAKGKPIDFDNVKFKFTAVDCIEKK